MLQYIIDAYKQEEGQKQFYKSLKNMDIISKICLTLLVVLCGFMLMSIFISNIIWFIVSIISIGAILLIYIGVSIKMRRKRWAANIGAYNNSLDALKEILCNESIKYYTKNKIVKLISQCEKEIKDLTSEKIKSKEDNNKFVQTMIVPIFSFAAGIMSKDIKSTEIMAYAIIAFFIVIMVNFSVKGFIIFIEDIEGDLIEERKYISKRLEDLLTRDFN